ncbi:TonB-dependent receptor [Mucilaginibacter puniceus]
MLLGAITLLCSSIAYAQGQTRRVTGIVTDLSTGETLIGATVAVKGSTAVTQVDVAGKFAVDVPANAVLVVRYVGYTDLEVPVEGKTTLDIKLAKVTRDLDEVVVTGFGLTTKKATLAGAVTQLSGDDLSQSRATSTTGALAGKIAGVNFRQNTGQPGASPVIRIRNFGGTGNNGNNPGDQPLIVIDGSRRDMDAFNGLDFNDVESINVLKDGSAAIYGFGGENGVIVVQTKKGKRGQKPTLSFDSYYGSQTYANFNKPGDVKSYIRGIVQTETYGDGKQSSPRTVTPEIYQKVMNGEPGYEGFDWYKYIYKSAPQAQAKISVSGGTENSDYYIAATTLNQGVALRDFGDGFKRQNIQANFNANISKRIRFGMQMNGYWSKQSNTNVEGGDFDWQAEAPYRNLPILPGPGATAYANPVAGPYVNGNPLYPQGTSPSGQQYSYGLVGPELSGVESTTRRNVSITGTLEIDILPGLKGRMLANYSFLGTQFDSRRMAPTLYLFDQGLGLIVPDPSFTQQRNNEHTFTNRDNTNLQFQLEYKKSIGKHNFQLNLTEESALFYSPSVRVTGIPPANNIPYIPNNGLTFLTGFQDDISNYYPSQGYQLRLNYDFAGKYIVEAFGRYDGSSNYRPADRWGFFPGGAVAYRISQEDFWKKSSVLSIFNDFKIKASYGITGFNIGSPSQNYLTGYDYGNGAAVLNGSIVAGAQVLNPPSQALSWGRTYTSNVGINMTLLNSRLSVELNYFNRTRTGIPANRGLTLPDLVGFQPGNENINTDKDRGVDGDIAWRDHIGEFNYGFNANFSYGRSITGFRYNQVFSSDYDRFRNNPVDRLQGGNFQFTTDGQFQSWEQIQNHGVDQDGKGNTTMKPGDFIIKDVNGDGFINATDQTRETYQINGGLPPLNFGFGVTANYKGVDLRIDFTGGSMYTFEQISSGFSNANSAYMREWVPNRNTSQYLFDNSSYYSDIFDRNSPIIVGKYPLLLQTNPAIGSNFSHSGWQTNVTYVRVRNLQIGYTIPYSVIKPLGLTNFRVYVAAQNLYTFSNMPNHIDPELVNGNGGGLPSPRVLTAGVQVKF